MPTLKIVVREEVWPALLEALDDLHGPIPDGIHPQDWAEQLAAEAFGGLLAEAAPPRTKSRIRPSRAHT